MKKSLPKLKKELDKWFSQYIRLRRADANGLVECFTCSKKDHWKKQQAGHFQSRRHLATRWDETNVQVQCVRCNMFNQGEQYTFGKLLDIRIKTGTSEKLELLAKRTTMKFMRIDYIEMIDKYKEKVKLLLKDCE